MKTPKVTEQINGYLFEWAAPLSLIARVSRLRSHSDGQVKGELDIKHRNGQDITMLLVPTQFNFSTELTRTRYAKQLTEKLSLPVDWKEIFDYLSHKVQELARSGDNYTEVWVDGKATPPVHWLDGLIYQNVQNIIYGEKGVSKSTIAYLLGLCVMLPWRDNPLHLSVPQESVKTLICDWETDQGIFQYYLTRLQRGMDIPLCSLFYRRCILPITEDIEAIQQHIESTDASLLVIDSLGAAAGAERSELKGAESALQFNSALRKIKTKDGLPITSLIIGQAPKTEEGKRKTLYGSVFFTYYARNVFELSAGQEEYADTSHLALFNTYCNLGRKTPPLGLRIDYNNEDGGISIVREAVSVSEFAQKLSTAARILDALKQGKMEQKQLREMLEVSYATLGMALKRLQIQRKVHKLGNEWGLLEDS